MRVKLLGLAAGGLMLALSPAAASAAEIDCVIERTPAPLKAEVDGIAARIVADSAGTPGGERSIAEKLDGQLKSCTATHRWSATKGKAAMNYAIATLLRGVLGREMTAKGISLSAVDGVIAANPAVFKAGPGANPTDEQRNKILADSRAAGLPIEDPQLANLVFTYFGAVAVLGQIANEFNAA